jgi:hypothetical protein
MDAAVDLPLEEPGGFQHAQMFGYGRKGNIERLGQLRDGGLALREARENGAAGGIGERAEGSVEPGGAGGIVNHVV